MPGNMYVYSFTFTLKLDVLTFALHKRNAAYTTSAGLRLSQRMRPIGLTFISPLAPIPEIIFFLDCIVVAR